MQDDGVHDVAAATAAVAGSAAPSASPSASRFKAPLPPPSPPPSPWLRRTEHALLVLPLLLLAVEAACYLYTSPSQCPALDAASSDLARLPASASGVQRALRQYLQAYAWLKCKDGLGFAAAVAAMAAVAAVVCAGKEPDDTHARRGASSGLLLGCLSVPLLLGAQLLLHAHLGVSESLSLLLWLSLCCSAMALSSVHFGSGGVSPPQGPGLCEVVTAALLSQVGMVVQDVMTFADTLVACFFFAYIVHFLLHGLPFSFSSGEAVAVATFLSLLLTHACFSLLAHALWLRGPESPLLGKLAAWAERAMVLDVSSASDASRSLQRRHASDDVERMAPVRFYGACTSLIVGVIILGLLWYRPFLLPFKRAQARARKRQTDAHTQPPLSSPSPTVALSGTVLTQPGVFLANADDNDRAAMGTATASPDGGSDGEAAEGHPTRRRTFGTHFPSDSVPTPSGAPRLVRLEPIPLRSRPSRSTGSRSHPAGSAHRDGLAPISSSSPSASSAIPSSVWSVPSLHLWMLAVIFLVVYPYIAVEMHCEPFTFILHYLISLPPSDAEFYARQRRLRSMGAPMDPQALPPSLALRAGSGSARLRLDGLGVDLDAGVLSHSIRMTILVCWCVIMALGVFLCAPAGTARRTRKVLSTSAEPADAQIASVPFHPVSPSSIRVASAATTVPAAAVHAPADVNPLALDPAVNEAAHPNGASGSSSARGVHRATLPAAAGTATRVVPNILVRKYYHFLVVLMFGPSILLEPGLVALSFSVALAVFVLMEYIRLARLPPFGERMHRFMQSYLDVRDSGVVILTHTYLLLGCALPLWLHLHVLADDEPQILQSSYASHAAFTEALLHAPARGDTRSGSAHSRYGLTNPMLVWNMQMYLPALAGVLVLGIGDSMASVVGVWAGRHRWFGSKRTVEGTAAAIICIFVTTFGGLLLMETVNQTAFQGKLHIQEPNWFAFLVATTLTCLLEAVTSQIDNLFLPLYYYTCMIIMFHW